MGVAVVIEHLEMRIHFQKLNVLQSIIIKNGIYFYFERELFSDIHVHVCTCSLRYTLCMSGYNYYMNISHIVPRWSCSIIENTYGMNS